MGKHGKQDSRKHEVLGGAIEGITEKVTFGQLFGGRTF